MESIKSPVKAKDKLRKPLAKLTSLASVSRSWERLGPKPVILRDILEGGERL